ncbi:MAG: hypothetical protein ABIO98_01980, partial [Chitinophagales bacterium]
ELERQLYEKNATLTPEKAIDIANTIFKITITTPISKTKESRLKFNRCPSAENRKEERQV